MLPPDFLPLASNSPRLMLAVLAWIGKTKISTQLHVNVFLPEGLFGVDRQR
jgi:hypothetical protein